MKVIIEKFTVFIKSPLFPGYLLLSISYLPGVLRTSFYSDDFPALIETKSTALNLVSDTRPVWGAGLLLFFSLAKFTSFYVLPKVVGFLGLLLLYRYTCTLFRKSDSPRAHNLIASMGFLLPSFGIWSHWSTSLFHSWGALLGLFAYENFKDKRRVLSIITMSVSCLIYPPATVFFFGVIFYRGIVLRRSNRELLSELFLALKLITMSGLFSLLFSLSLMKTLGIGPTSRVSLINLSEFPHKLIWFFSHPFVLGFFPASVHSPSFLQLVLIGFPVSLLNIYIILRGMKLKKAETLIRFELLFVFAILSIIPLMLSRDNQIELRLTPGVSWAIFCTSLYGLFDISKRLLNNGYRAVSGVLSLVLITFLIFGVSQRFQTFYLYQDEISTDFILKNIGICEQNGNLQSISIRENLTAYPIMPYLGTFSMTSDMASNWVPIDKTKFVLQRYFPNYSKIPVLLNSENPDTCNIYLEDFVRLIISNKRNSLL